MENKTTFRPVVNEYLDKFDCNQKLGTLAKAGIIRHFASKVNNDRIKWQLQSCDNLVQMLNVIDQGTDYLKRDRSPQQMNDLRDSLNRIVKVAYLKRKN